MSNKEFVDVPGTPADPNGPDPVDKLPLPEQMKQGMRHNIHVGRLFLHDIQDTYNFYRCLSGYVPKGMLGSELSNLPELAVFEKPAPLADPVEDQVANAEAYVLGLVAIPGPNWAKGLKSIGEFALASSGIAKTAAGANILPNLKIVEKAPETVKRVAEKGPDVVLGWRDQIGTAISERFPKP